MKGKGKKQVIVIDGVVGCGKTTLSKILEKELGQKLYEELENPSTLELLNRFYADKTRWAFTLQIHFLNQRFRQIKEIHQKDGGLCDRSIFGDRIFAEMLKEDFLAGGEGMTTEEFDTYSTLLDNMLEHAQNPTLLIYLQCSTDTAISRINKRNRGLESGVEKAYWERLNEKYEFWFDNYDKSPKLLIDVNNLDFAENQEDIDYILGVIKEKLKEVNQSE